MSGTLARIGRLVGALLAAMGAQAAAAGPRVMSLDQCADQYVLALAPRADIVGVSPRVGDRDSYLKAFSPGPPRRRASSEAVLAARPQVVVRYWGGDARLARTLAARGVAVAQIDEAGDFDGVRANVRRVAAALGEAPRGEALIARMDAQLRAARGAGGGREAVYLTPGGVTAGRGVLVDAMLRAAGFRNGETGAFYPTLSLERLALDPPGALVLGFFDAAGVAEQSWGVGRNHLARRLVRERAIASLPASVLGCPAWFAGDAVHDLASAAGRP
jgi:iron complex transport system substrate-binding protein